MLAAFANSVDLDQLDLIILSSNLIGLEVGHVWHLNLFSMTMVKWPGSAMVAFAINPVYVLMWFKYFLKLLCLRNSLHT